MENGKAVDQERQVHVHAGQNITVNFRDIVPMPLAQVPAATRQQ